MITKSLYGLRNSKLQQIYAFFYHVFPGHPLLVNYRNAYRPREEPKSSKLSIMSANPHHFSTQSNNNLPDTVVDFHWRN